VDGRDKPGPDDLWLLRRGEVAGQLVVGDLGQILVQLLDHDLGGGLAQRALELGDHAGRRHQHELIELLILEIGGERVGDRADEVLLGRLMQVAARLDRGAGGRGAFLDARRAVAPQLMRACVQLGGDEARQRAKGALIIALDETRPPAIGDDVPQSGFLHDLTPVRALDDRALPRRR
jgi:hypothetical protein